MTATNAEFLQYGFDPGVAGRCLLVVSVVEGEGLLTCGGEVRPVLLGGP